MFIDVFILRFVLMQIDLKSSFTRPCGAIIESRLRRSAMTEYLADGNNLPTRHNFDFYGKCYISKIILKILLGSYRLHNKAIVFYKTFTRQSTK